MWPRRKRLNGDKFGLSACGLVSSLILTLLHSMLILILLSILLRPLRPPWSGGGTILSIKREKRRVELATPCLDRAEIMAYAVETEVPILEPQDTFGNHPC
jgi:hypothetical protein